MNRAIVTSKGVQPRGALESAAETPRAPDDYVSRVMKLIPAEVIAMYLGIEAALTKLPEGQRLAVASIILVVFFVGTYFYLGKQNVKSAWQKVVSMIALVVWVFATSGGPLGFIEGGRDITAAYGPVIVFLFTFVIGLLPFPEPKGAGGSSVASVGPAAASAGTR